MSKCRECGKEYSEEDIDNMLIDLFGSLDMIDDDFLILFYGLCPDCWTVD